MLSSLGWFLFDFFNILVFIYFILLNTSYLLASLFAFRYLRRYAWRLKSIDIDNLITFAGAPPITLITPAYNEESTCVESIRSHLALNYPEYEILVVNDGSKDDTLVRMIDAFELIPAARAPIASLPTATIRGIYLSRRYPNLWVIDKENGGKADALNSGLNFARTPLFCAMDADSLVEREALTRLVRPFLEEGCTIAAGGIIRIVNGCTVRSGLLTDIRLPENFLAKFQVLEYLRAFLAGRMGWAAIDATLIISGAFGLFRRSTVVDAGGFATDTVGEDMELIVRLHKHCREKEIPYRISFIPDPVAWTECPQTLRGLARQRDRWQRGLMESLWRHRAMLADPRYGRIGLIAFPYFFFLEMLGPLIEVAGYCVFAIAIYLHRVSPPFVLAFLMVAFAFGVALSVSAVALEELSFRRYPRVSDLLQLFFLAILENFTYRPVLSLFRVRGFFSGLYRKKGWGKMERKGFQTGKAA